MSSPAPDLPLADFTGQLLTPRDPDYDAVRRVHNGLVDKRPAFIARCRGAADIVSVVRCASQQGLELAVRGGGHNVAGRATTEGGLLLDLSLMKGVHVDPARRRARAEGGVCWGEFNRETQVHALATTGGVVSTTGIAGLTLGGGIGWLMGRHGLAIDNLMSAQIVTADGRVLTASTEENPDLFWAIRGGGGNFGVAASFEYQLHPVGPTVMGGLIAFPFERARDVMRYYRDVTASAPDELTVFCALVYAPDGSGTRLAAMVACHCGGTEEAAAALAKLRGLGSPVVDALGPLPYTGMNAMLDASYPRGALNCWKSRFLQELSDAAIDTMVEGFGRSPSPMCHVLLEHVHGAVARVGVTDTAFPHRRQGYNCLVLGQWNNPADTRDGVNWARGSFADLAPFMASGRYVNYLDQDEAGTPWPMHTDRTIGGCSRSRPGTIRRTSSG